MNCAVCEQVVSHQPVVAFRDWEGLRPVEMTRTQMVYCHYECADENWYVIAGPWTVDERRSWVLHLSTKRWFNPAFMLKLPDLCHAAQTIVTLRRIQRHQDAGPAEGARNLGGGVRARIMERDRFHCRRCGCGPETRELVVDHVIPVVKGGTRDEANLQTLCVLCNAGKLARNPTPHDFARSSR